MKRVLLTGVSGVGKSTVIARLRELGHESIDMDMEDWSHYRDDGEYAWREDRLSERLDRDDVDLLFVGGAADNMRRFWDRFDSVVLLTTPVDLLRERLETRTTNGYGKGPGELDKIMNDREMFEPIARRYAVAEIVTTGSVDEIVAALLRIVSG